MDAFLFPNGGTETPYRYEGGLGIDPANTTYRVETARLLSDEEVLRIWPDGILIVRPNIPGLEQPAGSGLYQNLRLIAPEKALSDPYFSYAFYDKDRFEAARERTAKVKVGSTTLPEFASKAKDNLPADVIGRLSDLSDTERAQIFCIMQGRASLGADYSVLRSVMPDLDAVLEAKRTILQRTSHLSDLERNDWVYMTTYTVLSEFKKLNQRQDSSKGLLAVEPGMLEGPVEVGSGIGKSNRRVRLVAETIFEVPDQEKRANINRRILSDRLDEKFEVLFEDLESHPLLELFKAAGIYKAHHPTLGIKNMANSNPRIVTRAVLSNVRQEYYQVQRALVSYLGLFRGDPAVNARNVSAMHFLKGWSKFFFEFCLAGGVVDRNDLEDVRDLPNVSFMTGSSIQPQKLISSRQIIQGRNAFLS